MTPLPQEYVVFADADSFAADEAFALARSRHNRLPREGERERGYNPEILSHLSPWSTYLPKGIRTLFLEKNNKQHDHDDVDD